MKLAATANPAFAGFMTMPGKTMVKEDHMRNWQMLFGGAAVGVMVLTGCASKTSPADQDQLTQVQEYTQRTEQSAQAAQMAAEKAAEAAERAEAAANKAATAAELAAQRATEATDAAGKSTQAFEMGQMK
ncbi:MAG: hypothetical protein R2940_11140 [Syntrophotaleaceae bacterium]